MVEIYCFTGLTKPTCPGDIILLGLRDYQDKKADVILKYNADEARNLKSYGEIPDSVKVSFMSFYLYV